MQYTVSGPLRGSVTAPLSKSDLHRLMIAAALCPDECTVIHRYTMNDDIQATASVMEAAGAQITFEENCIRVRGIRNPKQHFVANCKESGSTLRFLTPVLAALGADCDFVGSGRLPQRPMSPLTEEMQQHGVAFSSPSLPFTIHGKLESGRYCFPGNVSSQYISGLLLALPLLDGDSRIVLSSPLESRAYVDMTLSVLRRFQIQIEEVSPLEFHIPGGQHYHSPHEIQAEGDWSNAAFWLCAGALAGPITVQGVQRSSLQGDKAVCTLLEQMGASLEYQQDAILVQPSSLHGIVIDGSQIPDIIPILAITAACAEGDTKIIHAGRLRIKECDRLAAVAEMLQTLGISVEEGLDELLIHGQPQLHGGLLHSYHDHRMAMCAAVASLRCDAPVDIEDPHCVEKSYPRFFDDFMSLGGVVHGIDLG